MGMSTNTVLHTRRWLPPLTPIIPAPSTNTQLGTMVGFEAEKNKTDYVRATGSNLAVSTIHTVSTAGTQTSAGYSWGNSMVSVLSKLDYNYDERYFISGSYRRDGSSGSASRNVGETSGQWQERGTSCARVL